MGRDKGNNGDEQVRTADLCHAKAALSQLSYIPIFRFHYSKLSRISQAFS